MASIVYVSSSTTDVITEIASTSEVIISNLQGPQGATGPQGPQGTPGGIASVVAPITNAGTETAAIIGINSSSANTANYVVQRDANKEFVAGAVTIDTTLTPTSAPGKLYWDGGGTVNLGLAGGNVSVALGENLVSYVTNAEATTLAVGEVVYVFGAAGDRPSVKRASNTTEATSSKTLGIVAESIGANQIGFVVTRGLIGKLTLGSYTAGQPVYLGATAGTFTSTKPSAPANLVALGWVIRANNGNGQIYLNVQNGFELDELHDVAITSAANGNFLVYDSADGLWKNQAISATAPITYNASTRTIAANAATTSATGIVQLSDSTSTTSSTLAATPTAVKAAFDLATTANATANAAIPLAQKAAANGVATLDASGLVPTNQLPALAITNTFVVNSQAAMLALTAQPGDVAIRTDLSESYILTADPASTLANWQELLSPPDAVSSVDGRVGAVTLTDKYAQLATANTFTGGVQQITTASAATAGLIIKASASQSANLLEVQDSISSVIGGFSAVGSFFTTGRISVGFTSAQGGYKTLIAGNTSTADVIVGVRGMASQTGDLTQWQNNAGSVLASISSAGSLVFTQTGAVITTPLSGRLNIGGAVYGTGFFGTISTNGDVGGYAIDARGSTTSGSLGVRFRSGNAANVTVVVQAESAQTADLQRWGNSSGTVLASVDSGGQLLTQRLIMPVGAYIVDSSAQAPQLRLNTGGFEFSTRLTTNVGIKVIGVASQTANLTEWQDSSANILSRISATGSLVVGNGGSLWSAPNGSILAIANSAAVVPVTVRGAASQTGDLTQWQNSAGTVLGYINSSGNLVASSGASVSGNLGGVANFVVYGTASNARTSEVIQQGASQTGDALQIQNSSGAVLSKIDTTGTFVGNVQDSQLIQYGAEGSVLQNIPTRVHPAETLLKQAVWWIDSAHSGSSGQAIKNLGWGGSALDATAGSSTAADTNDPKYLAWDGINYVYTAGTAGNYLSTPDANALDITGDIDLRVQVAMDDWTPSSELALITKWAGTRSYMLTVNTGGTFRLWWSTDGNFSASTLAASTVANTITDGTIKWVRATLDVDNGASGRDIKFFTSDDGITWTQLGTTVTQSGVTSIFSSNVAVTIGALSDNSDFFFAGKIYRAQILNGIDGVPVLDVDTSVIATGAATSFTALTGQTVTINRATSGRKTTCVTHPVWLFGTDDFMEVNNRWLERTTANYLYLPGVGFNYASSPDSAALDITGDIDLRVKVALDDWSPATDQMFIGKINTNQQSYYFRTLASGVLQFGCSTTGSDSITANSTVASGIADGSVKWVRATRVASTGVVQFFTSDDGTTWTQLGTNVSATSGNMFASTTNLEIGSAYVGNINPARGKFFRAQVLNGINGTVAFDANFETGITSNLPTTFTESSANAATVTINYSGTGYRSAGVIASTYVFPGNPNTFKLSSYSMLDFGASDSFTVFFTARQWATPTSFGNYINKKDNATNAGSGYRFGAYGTGLQTFGQIADGTNVNPDRFAAIYTAGTLLNTYGVADRTAQTFTVTQNSNSSATASLTGFGAISSPFSLRIGQATSSGTGTQDFEFISAAIFRRVLTAAEIATLNSYFQGRVA